MKPVADVARNQWTLSLWSDTVEHSPGRNRRSSAPAYPGYPQGGFGGYGQQPQYQQPPASQPYPMPGYPPGSGPQVPPGSGPYASRRP